MTMGVSRMQGEQYLKSAFSYLFIGDYERAVAAFHEAMEADPKNPLFAFHGSVTALRNGDLDLAERWAVRALAIDPTHPMYIQHLQRIRSKREVRMAETAVDQGDQAAANARLERALRLDPLNEQAASMLNGENAEP